MGWTTKYNSCKPHWFIPELCISKASTFRHSDVVRSGTKNMSPAAAQSCRLGTRTVLCRIQTLTLTIDNPTVTKISGFERILWRNLKQCRFGWEKNADLPLNFTAYSQLRTSLKQFAADFTGKLCPPNFLSRFSPTNARYHEVFYEYILCPRVQLNEHTCWMTLYLETRYPLG